ncbi:hypothetical protein [Kandleria vitulina]|uniref:hypothetical protein n=1 Tax=Kandleria vitulina TaxID=1630 RepID=UPI00048E63F6|nr:hypothetical protein [Kandleria vitulina]
MTVLYGVGTVLRFVLRVVLLPVQAVLTLLMLAIGFIGGLANIVCWLLGAFFVIGGICSFINGSASLGWQGLIVGIIVAVVPQALTLWGAEGIVCLKELLARI